MTNADLSPREGQGQGQGPRPAIMDDNYLDNLYYEPDEEEPSLPLKKVPTGDVFEASRAGDVERLKYLLELGVNVNARDVWDSVALYYACLAGHLDAARMLLESGAICAEHTFDGDRCHYAALNLKVRRLLKAFEARPPPLAPLQSALRDVFLSCKANRLFHHEYSDEHSAGNGLSSEHFGTDFAPDITFYVQGRPIEAHRAILVARSPFFKKKFETVWKSRKEIRFSKKLSYPALYSLVHFFYSDRLDIAVDDMEDLVRICKVCKCKGLKTVLEKELVHQKYAEYKSLRNADDSQKRFILQGSSLPEQERLPAAMHRLLHLSFEKSRREMESLQQLRQTTSISTSDMLELANGFDTMKNDFENSEVQSEKRDSKAISGQDAVTGDDQKLVNRREVCSNISTLFQDKCKIVDSNQSENHRESVGHCGQDVDELFLEDHADVCFIVEGKRFRSHQVILASRSEYFKARLSWTTGFLEGREGLQSGAIPLLEEHDLSTEAFEKLLEYMYTDKVMDIDPDQAEEMFDAASRYLLFSLKRAVADALLPQLETASPAELCHWLMLADMYGVWKIREHCLDVMGLNFEAFADTREFRRMLLSLPPPSGDSSQRTTAPSAPGEEGKSKQGNILDDLREKWLEAEAAELDKRDESAYEFDKRLEILVHLAEHEI